MNRLSRRYRITALAALLFHLVVVGVVPYADAAVESADPHVVHIDAGDQAPCPPGHDPAHCQLCRVIASQTDIVHGGFELPEEFEHLGASIPVPTAPLTTRSLLASPSPRGPPHA